MRKSWLIIITSLSLSISAFAQDTTRVKKPLSSREQVLQTIHIKAKIEKPSVSIIPTRLEPEISQMDTLFRSFSKEIKEGPEKLFYLEEEEKVEKIRDFKKLLTKKRK